MESVEIEARAGHSDESVALQYQQRAMVGHGSFGSVFEVLVEAPRPLAGQAAVKRVLQDRRFKNRELEIMKLLQHPNVVDLKAYFTTTASPGGEVYLHLVLEYLPETLYTATHWFHSRQREMPPLAVKLYACQLFASLRYIHGMHICHRDIKPQNLLIDPRRGILKLCDFGSAKILSSEPNVSYICSRYYRAPELIFGARNYTTKIDVWSAGCVLAEMCLGRPLFPGQSGIDQLVEIIKLLGTPSKAQVSAMNPNYMDHKFPSIKAIPLAKVFPKLEPQLLDLLHAVFDYSPETRFSAADCLAHAAFDEFRDPAFAQRTFPNYRGYTTDVEPTPMPTLDL